MKTLTLALILSASLTATPRWVRPLAQAVVIQSVSTHGVAVGMTVGKHSAASPKPYAVWKSWYHGPKKER